MLIDFKALVSGLPVVSKDDTPERALSSMNTKMTIQFAFLGEAFSTTTTSVGVFSCVDVSSGIKGCGRSQE